MCIKCGLNGCLYFGFSGHMDSCNDVAVVVWHDLLNDVTGEDFFTVDHAWYLKNFRGLTLEFNLKFESLFTTG